MAENNPYVGPASFTKDDRKRFFGRDSEARELSYLLIARRAVLLYAQSGAGKTSLLKAKVLPDFEDSGELRVLPMARVAGSAEGGNLYVANALASLKLSGATLTDALRAVFPKSDGDEVPCLLIFDQFEEIFTFHPELLDQRQAFLEQLRDCLEEYPKLGLLLAMREDYLADLDSVAGYLPDRMRTRMRMERLSDKQAEEAIALPAAGAGKPFEKGLARKLTDELRRVQAGRKTAGEGADSHALGKYVEPVQLQIVCRQLWSKLPENATAITEEHYKLARVDDALIQFYRDSIEKARKAKVTERNLRKWFGEKLITPAGTRGLVCRGDTTTEGLDNAAVDILYECYIIRADPRGTNTWYELTHDRLVEPVLSDNLAWKASYRNPVAEALERGPDTVLTGSALVDARDYAKEYPEELNPEEQRLLRKSEEQERARQEEEERARKRRRAAFRTGAAVILGLSALSVFAWNEARRAKAAEGRANVALVQSLVNSGSGLLASNREVDDLRSMLAALSAERYLHLLPSASPQLRADVRGVLQKAVYGVVERNLIVVPNEVHFAGFNQDGSAIAAVDETGLISMWDGTGKKLYEFQGPSGNINLGSAAFTADLGTLVTAHNGITAESFIDTSKSTVLVWDLKQKRQSAELKGLAGPVWDLGIDPRGRYLVTAGDDGLRFWDAQGAPLAPWGSVPERATRVTVSPDGNWVGWISKAGVRVLNVGNPGAVHTLTEREPRNDEDEVPLAFVPGRESLLVAGQLWDLKTFQATGKKVEGRIFSRDGAWIAKEVHGLPEVTTPDGELVHNLAGHQEGGWVLAFGPGHMVLTAGGDNTIRLWDLTQRYAAQFDTWRDSFSMAASDTPRRYATVDISYDRQPGGGMPVIGRDNAATLWSAEGKRLAEFPLPAGNQSGTIALSADSSILTACVRGLCQLWNTQTKASSYVPLAGRFAGMASLHGRLVLIGIDRDTVTVEDAQGVVVSRFDLPAGTHSAEPNAARTRLVAAGPSGVGIWDLEGKQVGGFTQPLAGAKVVPGSDTGRVAIAAAGFVTVFDERGKIIYALGKLPATAISPDGKLVAATGGPYSVPTLFDMETLRPVARYYGNGVFQFNFTADGKFVMLVGNDAPPRVWRVDTLEELAAQGREWIRDWARNNPAVSDQLGSDR